MFRRFIAIASVTVLACSLVGACGGNGSDDAEGRVSLKVGMSTGSLSSFRYWAADALGYFEDEGLDVELITTDGSAAVVQQLLAGNFDVGQAAADVLMNAFQKSDLKVFYPATREYRDWIVPKESELSSISDFKGKVVGVSDASGSEVTIVKYLLEEAGIDVENEVEIAVVGDTPAAIASAFTSKRIDSFAGAKSGITPFLLSTDTEYETVMPKEFSARPVEYVAASEKLKGDTDVLAKFARALAKGNWYCQANIESCLDVIKKARPSIVQDRTQAKAILEVYRPLSSFVLGDDGNPIYGVINVDDLRQDLEIASSGDQPLIKDPSSIDLESHLLDLRSEVAKADFAAVKAEANSR